jgi:hypothetical protein
MLKKIDLKASPDIEGQAGNSNSRRSGFKMRGGAK